LTCNLVDRLVRCIADRHKPTSLLGHEARSKQITKPQAEASSFRPSI